MILPKKSYSILKNISALKRMNYSCIVNVSADEPMRFKTANKETEATEIVDYYVEDLGRHVTAWVVGDSPALISLGRLI